MVHAFIGKNLSKIKSGFIYSEKFPIDMDLIIQLRCIIRSKVLKWTLRIFPEREFKTEWILLK